MFFFVKQKTAYEMRISDWSSDVCSSDLHGRPRAVVHAVFEQQGGALGAQHAIGNLGHFQVRRDRRGNALKLATQLQLLQEVSKVAVFHYRSRSIRYIFGVEQRLTSEPSFPRRRSPCPIDRKSTRLNSSH